MLPLIKCSDTECCFVISLHPRYLGFYFCTVHEGFLEGNRSIKYVVYTIALLKASLSVTYFQHPPDGFLEHNE